MPGGGRVLKPEQIDAGGQQARRPGKGALHEMVRSGLGSLVGGDGEGGIDDRGTLFAGTARHAPQPPVNANSDFAVADPDLNMDVRGLERRRLRYEAAQILLAFDPAVFAPRLDSVAVSV